MIFTDIRLQNFRSYTDSSFELGKGVNIIVGPNAAGKTNIIEALMLVSGGKSYRSDSELIKTKKEWARVDAHTTSNDMRTVKLTNEPKQKTFEIEQKTYKRLPFSKQYPVVLFEPNNLLIVGGEPSGRRVFIDTIISQTTSGYSSLLSRYKRVLTQRNSLLKSISRSDKQLFVWDIKLTELASEIINHRLQMIEKINLDLSKIYSFIAKNPTKISIKYSSSVPTQNYNSNLLKKLQQDTEKDIAIGFTGSGPHRDDLIFDFEEKTSSLQASRGETRSLVLSLKLIEVSIIEESTGLKPLLLLDDVFSELDGQRRKTLTSYLKGHQTVITTTDADIVAKNFTQTSQVISIEKDQS